MGRNRTPIAMRLHDGSYREDRHGIPLATPAGMPVKPDWLPERASQIWDSVVHELAETDGLLTPLDGPALAAYAVAWQRFHEARELIARDGIVIEEKGGVKRRHPATMVEAKALEQIASIGAKFGLTPSARASLAIDAQSVAAGVRRRLHYRSADDELEELIR